MRRTTSISPRLRGHTGTSLIYSSFRRTSSAGYIKFPKLPRERKRISPIHEAAYQGDIDTLKSLIKRSTSISGLLGNKDESTTPLHEAAYANRVDCVQFLLENTENCDEKDVDGLENYFRK